ncbi:hypothetical protein CCACVL1_26006 [Corchorus capsularis]|uniref:HMA domain-containing protein n=1 Tax=Corchorus capsularis TaxID=210143 RepID=A0A1R3GGE7_COCAP|nr:hypothetical protein CCACVL1_26006 [Corchorus capsularis]
MAELYYWQQYHHGNLEVKVEKNNGKEENGADKSNTKGKEIILKVYMHCEGCALKVFNCLKAFEGVEEVKTEWKGNRVIVKGEKADPLKVLERVKKKYSRNAELLYPKPKANEKKVPVPQKKQEIYV